MAAKLCADGCGRPRTKLVIGPELCDECLEYAEWENTHDDEGHELEGMNSDPTVTDDCPVCHPELDPRKVQDKPNKAKTPSKKADYVRRTQLNHKEMCTHPQTPKARRTCKEAFWKGVYAMMAEGNLTEDQAWEHCIKTLTAPKKGGWAKVTPRGPKGGVINKLKEGKPSAFGASIVHGIKETK